MSDTLLLVTAVVAAVVGAAAAGWFLRGHVYGLALRRKQRFFGLPDNSECLLVVSRETGADGAVSRNDVFALLELAALIKACHANAQVMSGDAPQQGFGERTEICLGNPLGNRRMAAHLHSLMPGVSFDTDTAAGPDRGSLTVGTERHRLVNGSVEHVLLARLTAGQGGRPVFLACGQRSITHQAAARHLAKHHVKLARRYGSGGNFVLLFRVVNSQAYGPDVVEVIGDVTKEATTPRTGLTTSKGA
ncbi:hypothetical protein [Streptomyces lonarensis]|uniref:Secreted protein n=1 Tax=Streptomyces lonarensis TaxID=700599 RepID=A0A7X6HZI0_9ACTN|nr:hypothetical protein [Streptomyces lonarensis]NJQ06641.1 hypothetical protein [Streptomyces lonarensis]